MIVAKHMSLLSSKKIFYFLICCLLVLFVSTMAHAHQNGFVKSLHGKNVIRCLSNASKINDHQCSAKHADHSLFGHKYLSFLFDDELNGSSLREKNIIPTLTVHKPRDVVQHESQRIDLLAYNGSHFAFHQKASFYAMMGRFLF